MDDRILFLIARSQHVLKSYLKSEFSRAGVTISPAQMGILFSLGKKNGLPMNEFSRILSIDNAAVTRHIDSLVKNGFVQRSSDDDDRRKSIITITAKGTDQAAMAKKVARRVNGMVGQGFTAAEIDTFKSVLNSFFNKFSKPEDTNG